MIALGRALALSTLAFGTIAWGNAYGGWHNQQNNDNQSKHYKSASSHKYDMNDAKQRFYKLHEDDRMKLCNNDRHWNNWAWYFGENREELCADYRVEGKVTRDSDKHATRHEDKATHQVSEPETYVAAASGDQQANISLSAPVTVAPVVNNYTYVHGDNNVVTNNVSVTATANVEQQAAVNQVSTASATTVIDDGKSDQAHGTMYQASSHNEQMQYNKSEVATQYDAHSQHVSQQYGHHDTNRGNDWDSKAHHDNGDCYGDDSWKDTSHHQDNQWSDKRSDGHDDAKHVNKDHKSWDNSWQDSKDDCYKEQTQKDDCYDQA